MDYIIKISVGNNSIYKKMEVQEHLRNNNNNNNNSSHTLNAFYVSQNLLNTLSNLFFIAIHKTGINTDK